MMKDWFKLDALAQYSLSGALVLVSGLVWYGIGQVNMHWFTFANFGPGIDLVYLPAGFRLAIVLIARVWGATGIAIANTVLFVDEFRSSQPLETMTNSIIAGFGPLLAIWLCCKVMGIDVNLTQLSPKHLPILALIVSLVTPLLFNLHFLIYNIKPLSLILPNVSAMILGDFLGCLVVLIAARLAIGLAKQVKP